MSFFYKCLDGKAVPCRRARHGEVSPTDRTRSPCTRYDECPAVRRSQLPPADDGRNGDTHVSQVGRRQTIKAFVGDHRQLEGAVPEASGVDEALEYPVTTRARAAVVNRQARGYLNN